MSVYHIRFPYVPRHHAGANMCPGTTLVLIFVQAPFQCSYVPGPLFRFPYVPEDHSGAQLYSGTIPVPIFARAPFQCPYMPGSPFDRSPDNFPVPKCAQAPFRCPYVTRHHSCSHMCPSTNPVPIYARAPFRCTYVPGLSSGAHMCLGTLLVSKFPLLFRCTIVLQSVIVSKYVRVPHSVPLSARAPFRCPYVFGHHYGAHMYPATIMVP